MLEKRRQEMRRQARLIVVDEFSWDAIISQVRGVINE
jgi:glycosyltransferase involved in cell wall biosynthesis